MSDDVIRLPQGWQVVGALTPQLWSALPIEDLTEDLVQIQSMDGSRLVDVGWYPEMDPKFAKLNHVVRAGGNGMEVEAMPLPDVPEEIKKLHA